MTLVVGLAHESRVYIGTDSAEAGASNLTIRRDPQVVWKGSFLFGFPGVFRLENLVRYRLPVPEDEPATDVRGFLALHVAETVRAWIREELVEPQVRAATDEIAGIMLVGYRGRLFMIGSDGQVVEAFDGYDALGTGDEVALGAMRATRRESPEDRVYSALHAAAYLTGAVRPPFHVWCLDHRGDCTKCADRIGARIAHGS